VGIIGPTPTLAYWDYIFLAGLIGGPPDAHLVIFPQCELTVTRELLVPTDKLTSSYGWPIPNRASVPYWALIDVATVR
jgi:hypothetical protein